MSDDEFRLLSEEIEARRAASTGEAIPPRSAADLLPPPPNPGVRTPEVAAAPAPGPEAPAHPDGRAVNEGWDLARVGDSGGVTGRLQRWLRGLLRPLIEAQTSFNAHQVQLDNQIIEYLDARFDATHRHYDEILGLYGGHLQDANQRHVLLEREVVAHVHDLVKRIDLVLAHGERDRVALEAALRMVRARLAEIDARTGDQMRGGAAGGVRNG